MTVPYVKCKTILDLPLISYVFMLLITMATLPSCAAAKEFKPIRVENGIFVYPDGGEVNLFGTNYHPMSWHQYTNMKTLGADFLESIKQDVSDMKACGVQIVRVHVFESEICDTNGNILENEHLYIFDMLVDELNRQGIYLYLTPLGWWESPHSLPDAYSRQVSKMGMMYVEEALGASENFIAQLLTRINPRTQRRLKDEPCLAVIEIINEPWYWPYESIAEANFEPGFLATQVKPEIVNKDFELWEQMWRGYCEGNKIKSSRESYFRFQYEKMSTFLRRMIGAIRNAGANQPIASALFESYQNKAHSNEGILRAIGESDVDAVTDGWYPGAFSTLHEYVNQMPAEAQAYQLPHEVQSKAKMIYEFDICRTYNNVGMYPAMARRWRSMGAQIVCQFQYDSVVTAQYNSDWDVHFFNYEVTPAKAVAFKIAAETFAAIPRGTQYPTPQDNEIFYGTAVSFTHKQAMRATDDQIFYAHGMTGWSPLELPTIPKLIMGRGNSQYVEYTGSGLYVLDKISDRKIRLSTTRNAVVQGEVTKEFFGDGRLGIKKIVELDSHPQQFRLKFPDWDVNCFDEQNKQIIKNNDFFEITPGKTYYLHNSK